MRKFNFLSILLMGMLLAPLSSASAKSLEPAKGRVGLGYTESSGNTDESKMNFTLNLTQKRTEQLKFGYDALAIYGKSDTPICKSLFRHMPMAEIGIHPIFIRWHC